MFKARRWRAIAALASVMAVALGAAGLLAVTFAAADASHVGRPTSVSADRPLVVLIGGLGSNIPSSGGDWSFVKKRLKNAGYEVRVAATAPNAKSGQDPDVINSNSSNWAISARRLDHQLVQAHLEGRRIVLVGHSMGGLIARVYAQDWRSLTSRCKPLGIVQLSTPNKGSDLASLAWVIGKNSDAAKALGNAKIMTLFNKLYPNADGLPIYRIAGNYFPKPAKAWFLKHRTKHNSVLLSGLIGVYGTSYNDSAVTVDSVRGGPTAGWRGCAVFKAVHSSNSDWFSDYLRDAGCVLPYRTGKTGGAAVDEAIMKKITEDVRAIAPPGGPSPSPTPSPTSTTGSEWKAAFVGPGDTLAIESDGTLWAWGWNDDSQLGLGDTAEHPAPTQVGDATNWATVACGYDHTLGLRTDSTLWAWGRNSYGSLGLGDSPAHRDIPTQVDSARDWASVSAGENDSLALKTDGTLWAWGWNWHGELGLGDTSNRSVPTQVGRATDWVAVSEGLWHTVALKRDGTLWAWGYNDVGQLGLGDTIDRVLPTQVGIATDWVAISAGYHYSCALKRDGTLWAWGWNCNSQLGLGDSADRFAPTQVAGGHDWEAVAAGLFQSVALRRDGTLWNWGDTTSSRVPAQMGSSTDWLSVCEGYYHTLALKTDGTLWAWGSNGHGELGLGDTISHYTPTQVLAP
jgi:alpha-tubulin suppressor-like RCC1 family protein/pimeloyl-ACP methyl ester carboxylesterase